MKRITFGILFCLAVLSVPFTTVAQTAQAPDPTQYVTVSGNFAAFNATSSMSASSNLGAALKLTTNLSGGYNQLSVSALSRTYKLGVANYTRPLCSYLGVTLSKKFVFDTCQLDLTVQVGAGKVTQTGTNSFNNIAETVGVGLSVSLASHLSWAPVQVNWLHGGQNPQNALLSSGLNLHF